MVARHAVLAVLVLLALAGGSTSAGAEDAAPYELWAIDQSNTTPTGGGTLHIVDGPSLEGNGPARGEVVDLGLLAEPYCVGLTGSVPTRPHMLVFSPGDTHAIVAYVATGHVLFLDAASRMPVGCLDVGAQAHAAFPSPDGRYVVVANQNGKRLQRIWTDWESNSFVLDPVPLDLGALETAQRPDNAPICPIVTDDSAFTFVTLRGGGLYVVASGGPGALAIVAAWDRDTVHPNGCGGVQVGNTMYVNSGGGTAANPLEADLYRFAWNGVAWTGPWVIYSHDARGFVDSHGATLTKHGRHLWVADRAANRIVIVDTASNTVTAEVELAGAVSPDPAPDLLATSPSGNRVFFSMRGPNPLTANVAGVNNAVGATPGVGVVRVERGGAWGTFVRAESMSRLVAGVERADPHALRVRRK